MDLSTLADDDDALILKILEVDAQTALTRAIGKGKQREGFESDEFIAFDSFLKDLRDNEAMRLDRRMARSIQGAIRSDEDALVRLQKEERTASKDRERCLKLDKGQEGSAMPTAPSTLETIVESADNFDDELAEKLSFIYITGGSDLEGKDEGEKDTIDGENPESSSWAARRKPPTSRARQRPCVACGDEQHFTKLCRALCGHEYCEACILRLFQDAMVDETLFPPRCCKQPIPVERIRLLVSNELIKKFNEKSVEFSTSNRIYCSNKNCGVFMPPSDCIHSTVNCRKCGTQTCCTCKRAAHDGDCPDDKELQQVINLAEEQGWQRCQKYLSMVELGRGCNHMT